MADKFNGIQTIENQTESQTTTDDRRLRLEAGDLSRRDESMQELCAKKGTGDRLWYVAWSPCGTSVATCGDDKVVKIYQLSPTLMEYLNKSAEEGRVDVEHKMSHLSDLLSSESSELLVKAFELEEVHSRTIRCVEFSHSGNYLATASFDSSIIVYHKTRLTEQGHERLSWEIVAMLEGHENEVKSLAWNQDDSILASCSRDKTIWLWEVPDGTGGAEVLEDWECLSVLTGHTQDVKFVSFAPEQNLLFSCSYDNTIRVWKEASDDWECCLCIDATQNAHSSTVWQLAFFPPSATGAAGSKQITFVSCSQDISVKLWAYHVGENRAECLQTIECADETTRTATIHSRTIFTVSVNKTGSYVASGGADDSIVLYQLVNQTLVPFRIVPSAHSSDTNCLRFSTQHDRVLASVGDDATIKLWMFRC